MDRSRSNIAAAGDRMILPSTSSICYFCHGINQSSTFFSWRKVSFKATCQAVIIYIYPPINHLGLFRSTTLKLEAYDFIWRRFYNVVIAHTQLTTYFFLALSKGRFQELWKLHRILEIWCASQYKVSQSARTKPMKQLFCMVVIN